jgi:hypothetical protein
VGDTHIGRLRRLCVAFSIDCENNENGLSDGQRFVRIQSMLVSRPQGVEGQWRRDPHYVNGVNLNFKFDADDQRMLFQ